MLTQPKRIASWDVENLDILKEALLEMKADNLLNLEDVSVGLLADKKVKENVKIYSK